MASPLPCRSGPLNIQSHSEASCQRPGKRRPRCLFPSPGTIRTCQKFLIQYNRRQLLVLLQNCTDEGKSRWADVGTQEGVVVTSVGIASP